MKRYFTRLKALLLIHFSLWFTSLSAQTNITTTIGSYNSSTCAVGDTIVLPVSVNMASGISISAIALTIDFDNTKLLCIPTAPNSGVYATQVHSMVAAGFLSNVTVFPNQNPNPPYSASTRNQFRAVWFNLVPVAFNGIMFNLRFVVLSTGSSTVKWDLATPGNCEYADELAELISNCEFTDGNITCGSAAIGPCVPLNASITPSGPTSFCQGDSVTLEAYISAGLTYQWRNNGTDIPGATNATYVTSNTGLYSVLITDGSTCSSLLAPVPVTAIFNSINNNLFPTDTLLHCGDSLVLDAGTGYTRYEWSSGDTTQTKTVRYTGWHRVRVYDGSCSVEDSVFVSIISQLIEQSDTMICSGSSIELNLQASGINGSLRNGLVGYWPFNGNANDVSGNGNHGAVNGATLTTDRFGNQNGAYSFTDNSNIDVGTQILGSSSANLSYSIWVNGSGALISKRHSDGGPSWATLTTFYFSSDAPGYLTNSCQINNSTFWIQGWNHIVATKSNNVFSVYLNGTFLCTFSDSYSLGSNQSLKFGYHGAWNMHFNGTLDDIGIWNRALTPSEIQALYNSANGASVSWSTGDTTSTITVSPTQTTTYYATVSNGIHSCVDSVTVTVIPNPLNPNLFAVDSLFHCGDSLVLDAGTGYTRYEWSSGDTTQSKTVRYTGWHRVRVYNGLCSVEDSVFVSILQNNFLESDTVICQGSSLTINTNIHFQGQNLNTTIGGYWPLRSNTLDYSSFNNHAVQNNFSSTIFADGLYFDGIDDHLSISAEKNQNCSFSFWFKTNNSTGDRMFFNAGPNGNGPDLFLSCGQLNWNVWDGCNNPLSAIPNNYADNQYHHIILTNHIIDGSKLFFDGILIGSASYRNAGLTNLLYLAGAGNYGDYCWNGYMSDFILFKKALSPSEVQFIHNRGRVLVTNLSFLWSTGDTTAAITVSPTQTTTYYVTVSNGIHSCVDSVTVNVIPNTLNPNLFAVDSLFHCGDSLVLDAGTGYTRYEWSSGDTTQIKAVRSTGWHRVRAYDGLCSVEDSVFVSIIPPKIEQNDTTICSGSSIELNLHVSGINGSLRNGLVGYWPFNGNANDVSGNGNHGAVNGATLTTDRFGNLNSAYSFNGSSSYIKVNNSSSLESGNLSISFWIQSTGNQFQQVFYKVSPNTALNETYSVCLNLVQPGTINFDLKNNICNPGLGWQYSSSNIGPVSNWSYFTLVHDGATSKIYRNGQLLNSFSRNFLISNCPGGDLLIGCDWQFNNKLNGKLDDIGIWNRALTPSEIQGLYNSSYGTSVSWSTGDTTSSITVSPTQTTTYYVTVSNGIHSCVDSVTVNVIPNPLNPNIFAADTLFHCGDSLVLDAGIGYSRYEWTSGDTIPTHVVRLSGWYRVKVYDGVCSVEDSIYVSIIDDNISNTFFSVCKGSEVKLTTKRAFPQSLNNGLVGLWHGNNSTDDAGPNFYNAISNQVTYGTNRFNKPRSAFVFNSFSQLTTQCSISSPSYTVAFWSISDSCSNGFTTIVDLGNKVNGSDAGYIGTGPCNPYCGINQSSRFIYDGMGGCNNILMSQPNSILAGSWVHTAISRDSNGMTNLYLNGTLVDSTNILDYNGYTQIQFGNPGVSHKGKLDEIGLWDRRLTSAEVLELFNSNDSYLYSWSTGDTTSSITVSPTQTTTYYVTISNGIHSCVDSVTVRVTPKVFVPDMAVCQGDTINVPIIASSLDSVAAISLALNYNQQAMTYVGYTGLRPDMVSTTSIGTAPGQVRLGWFGLSSLISTGPDTLVYYRFVVNQPGGFNWNTQVQGDCELADLNLNILDYCFEGGNLILIDTVSILSSSQGPFEVEIGASIPLSVQSTGATSLQWQRWNPQQGVWTNLQNNADYAGVESGTLTYTCNTYQRPFPLFRLQLSNGCRNWYGPAMQVTLKQRITISVGQFTACQGDTVEVPLTVTGARELGAVSLTLGFNPGAVQFVDWINTAASTQSNIWLSNQVGNEIRLAWFSLISANIPDGNALGTLRIVVTNSTPLTWDLVTPGNCEFADEEAETIPAQFLSGNLTVNSLPTVNLGISSPFICPNAGSATLSTISDPNYTYAWYLNGQILPNSSDHSITTSQAGTYQVLVTNSSGCSRWSSPQTLGHYPLPNPVITATGSTTTCNQPVSLSVNSTQGGVVEYRWFLNGTLLSTTPSNQWVATVSGSYSVQAIDIGTGCSAWSSAMAVAINPLPNPVITFNGPSTFCLGDSLLLNIPNLSGHLYQWNSGSTPIPGATSASLMVRQGGQYTVQVTNEFACQNLSSPVTITTQNCNALSGVLSYNNTANTVLRNSKVYLALQNGSLVDSSATNNSGQYSIAGYSNNLYQIRATSSINWGGVNATDALGTVRHYTNVVPITGLRLKAADVNGSNSVNNTDALLITRRYSNLLSGFNVGNWASENISIQAAGTPLTQNLKAICYGDINGSYNPSLVRLAPKITVLSSGLVYTEKHVVRWPLYAADNQVLGAVSLVMGIPQGLELVAVQSYLPNGHMEFGQNADELRVGWFSQEGVQTSVGQHLFDLVLRISDEQRSEWTPQEWEMRGLSELADYWATPYEFGRLSMPSISRIRESLVTSKDLLAIPNPSSGDTKLQWTLSAPVEHAYVRVVDALGRVVMEENIGTLEEGSHTLDLPSAGWALGSYGAQLLYTSQDGRSNRLGTILKRIR